MMKTILFGKLVHNFTADHWFNDQIKKGKEYGILGPIEFFELN